MIEALLNRHCRENVKTVSAARVFVRRKGSSGEQGLEDREPIGRSETGQWQVLQDLVEQEVQLEAEVLMRLEPPPMPNEERIFWAPDAPQSGQAASFSLPMATRLSNRRPHFLQINS
jgi:hypothetical protein